ncbi:acyl carrier protein [Paenibacillus polysaccharolyticus]|uniref:acyl carrier protein n=1 Tax=Paenibacillus polysaccharolyticus TaxID=582692 RepID=UPI00203FBB90|nr:acyl carrier protein [Paenibacillus polysaccharolyticus]MCM3135793.1 acyl carrier protein [Paenibacillus polysaccharolyticus]
MLNETNAFERLKKVLAESLDIEPNDIQLNQKLFVDYTVESTETLEITFRLEQEFDLTMEDDEFWNIANLIANNGMYNGKFTEEAVQLIQSNFDISEDVIQSLDSPFSIYHHITINDLLKYTLKKTNNS